MSTASVVMIISVKECLYGSGKDIRRIMKVDRQGTFDKSQHDLQYSIITRHPQPVNNFCAK